MRIRGALLIGALALYLFPAGGRAEDCDCERYRDLARSVVPLSSLAATSALAIFHPMEGRAFSITPQERRALQLQHDAEKMIPIQCQYLLPKMPRMTLVLRGVFAPNTADHATGIDGYHAMAGWYDLREYYLLDCHRNPASAGLKTADGCMQLDPGGDSYSINEAAYNAYVNGLDPQRANKTFQRIKASGIEIYRDSAPSALELKTYKHFINSTASGNSDGLKNYLRSIRDQMSIEERLALVQFFGARFRGFYDERRRDQSLFKGGVVTLDQLIQNEKANRLNGNPDTFTHMGVCRDIASAQGEMLEALGFSNSYVVTFATMKTSHTTVITQDPRDSKRFYKINYGDMVTGRGVDGSQALYQGSGDISVNYRINRPSGETVKTVPSELGKVLAEAAGFDIRTLDALARPRTQLLGTQVTWAGQGTAGLVLSNGPMTGTVAGLSGGYSWGAGGYFPGQIGVVGGRQFRSETMEKGVSGRSIDFLYAQFQQKLLTPSVQNKAAELKVRIETTLTALGMGSLSHGEYYDKTVVTQGDLRLMAGIRVEQGNPDDWKNCVASRYFAGAETTPGVKDVRGNEPMVVLNGLLFTAEGRACLFKTSGGRAYLTVATTILSDEFGLRGKGEVGLVLKQIALMAGAQGTLHSSGPAAPYMEGSLPAFTLRGGYQPSTRLLGGTLGTGVQVTGPLGDQGVNALSLMGTLYYTH